jgi:hypothetical protein
MNKNFELFILIFVFIIIPVLIIYNVLSKKSSNINFDLLTDVNNCGQVGNNCNANGVNYVCTNGSCTCPQSQNCYCNESNCSLQNQRCAQTGCECIIGDLAYCAPFCVNTNDDSNNCGVCDNICEQGTICLDAECVTDPN